MLQVNKEVSGSCGLLISSLACSILLLDNIAMYFDYHFTWCLCSTLLACDAALSFTLYITFAFTWYACSCVSFMSFRTNVHQYNVSTNNIMSLLMLLLLLPPQIGLMKDTLFVDLFLWDHKKVNQEEVRTNKCQVYAMQFEARRIHE